MRLRYFLLLSAVSMGLLTGFQQSDVENNTENQSDNLINSSITPIILPLSLIHI